ncbi:MAG: hypothetical protein KC561_19140, partial [Myxococcales bacterium]|nr:hypothetical protein [Myxococcales bacterium]
RSRCAVNLSGDVVATSAVEANYISSMGSVSIGGNLTLDSVDLDDVDLSIGGTDVDFYDGSDVNTAFRDSTLGFMGINPDFEFDDVTFNGRVDIAGTFTAGDINIGDEVFEVGRTSFDGSLPIFRYEGFDMGTSTSWNTGISSTDYLCLAVGVDFGPGNINQSATVATPYAWLTYKSGGTWWIGADAASHNSEHETHEVDVLCIQRGVVDDTDSYDPNW